MKELKANYTAGEALRKKADARSSEVKALETALEDANKRLQDEKAQANRCLQDNDLTLFVECKKAIVEAEATIEFLENRKKMLSRPSQEDIDELLETKRKIRKEQENIVINASNEIKPELLKIKEYLNKAQDEYKRGADLYNDLFHKVARGTEGQLIRDNRTDPTSYSYSNPKTQGLLAVTLRDLNDLIEDLI